MIFISLERSCNTLWDDEKNSQEVKDLTPKRSLENCRCAVGKCMIIIVMHFPVARRQFSREVFGVESLTFLEFFFIIPQSIAKPFQRRKNQIWGPILGRAMSPQSLPNFWVFAPKIQIFRHFIHYRNILIKVNAMGGT